MMKKGILIALGILGLTACSSTPSVLNDQLGVNMLQAEKVYNIVNLHPDEAKARLYSVNYQLAGFLPRCTEVKITELSEKAMIFTVPSRENKKYTYLWHRKATPEGLNAHLKKFFASSCDDKNVKKMSAKDQAGIKSGQPALGMTREGIKLAMGLPPSHVNFDIDSAKEWLYWRHKFAKRAIVFDDKGIVIKIR